jgi:glycosyltransferase involved in cell wall biosynthesis
VIRILFPFVGDTLGGSNFSSLLLIQHLDRRRYEPVLLLHEDGPFAEYLRRNSIGFELLTLPGYLGLVRGVVANVKLLVDLTGLMTGFLRRRRIAIVHTNDSRMHLNWALPGKLAGCRLVRHQRTLARWNGMAGRLLGRLADRILCISSFVFDALPPSLRGRAVLVPNPFEGGVQAIDRAECRRKFEAETGVSDDVRIVGFFSNLLHRKRPAVFIETAAMMSRGSPLPLAFAMFGEEREVTFAALREQAERAGISKNVYFMGFRSPVEPWIAACDLVVAPAVEEPFGRVLVEAMLVGTPVVATESGGHQEIIDNGKTGLLAATDNPAALAQAGLVLLRDYLKREDVVRQARANASSRFGVMAHVQLVSRQYDGLVG